MHYIYMKDEECTKRLVGYFSCCWPTRCHKNSVSMEQRGHQIGPSGCLGLLQVVSRSEMKMVACLQKIVPVIPVILICTVSIWCIMHSSDIIVFWMFWIEAYWSHPWYPVLIRQPLLLKLAKADVDGWCPWLRASLNWRGCCFLGGLHMFACHPIQLDVSLCGAYHRLLESWSLMILATSQSYIVSFLLCILPLMFALFPRHIGGCLVGFLRRGWCCRGCQQGQAWVYGGQGAAWGGQQILADHGLEDAVCLPMAR